MTEQLDLKGQLWVQMHSLSDHWEMIGLFVVSLFIASWFVSVMLYRIKGYDYIETGVLSARESNEKTML